MKTVEVEFKNGEKQKAKVLGLRDGLNKVNLVQIEVGDMKPQDLENALFSLKEQLENLGIKNILIIPTHHGIMSIKLRSLKLK